MGPVLGPGGAPPFRDLPVLADGLRCSWGVFGDDDELGTVNRITDAAVVAAMGEVLTGERINVTLPLDLPDPPFYGRGGYRHTISAMAPSVQDDVLDGFHPQGSTQWDGLRHRGHPQAGYYGGVPADQVAGAGTRLGIGHWAATGLTGRGVLADVAGHLEREGVGHDPSRHHEITPELLRETLAAQGTAVRAGDVLLVRTGFIGAYLRASRARRTAIRDSGAFTGLSAAEEMAEYLWDGGFAAVAVDNPAVEAAPRDPAGVSLHARLIPALGFALGEFFTFERLATAARADGRYSCLFVSVPLNLPGGVGSPANALAIR